MANHHRGYLSVNVGFMSALSDYLQPILVPRGRRQEVIRNLGVSTQTVGRWIKGIDVPKFYYLMWLAHRYSLDAGKLIDLAELAAEESRKTRPGREDLRRLYETFPWKVSASASNPGRSDFDDRLHQFVQVVLESPEWAQDMIGTIISLHNSAISGVPRIHGPQLVSTPKASRKRPEKKLAQEAVRRR